MATFKAVVMSHQLRRDGKFPVSIRLTHNRRSVYIGTGLYVSRSQIHRKTFEIKDQFVLTRTGQTIREWERKLLQLSTDELLRMDVRELKRIVMVRDVVIDYLDYCRGLIKEDAKRWLKLRSAVGLIEAMGISRLPVTDFTSRFIYEYKQFMDSRVIGVKKVDGKEVACHYKERTKNSYLIALCSVFRRMQREYNTEYERVISHDPFIGFSYYKERVSDRRSMSVDELRAFFSLESHGVITGMVRDMMLMSFCMCGINVGDLLMMRKADWDVAGGRVSYCRQKTKGRRGDNAYSSIRIEPEIGEVFSRWLDRSDSEWLFDFRGMRYSRQTTRNIAMSVYRLCRDSGFRRVSPYWFRHSWATIARNECDVSKDDIDLCLNHVGMNKMADVYIKPDWSRIDRANRKVLDYVFREGESK